jgi:hypothetical protein
VRRKVTFRLPAIVAVLSVGFVAVGQTTHSAPATDSAAQASPIQSAPAAHVNDSAQQASPIPSPNGHGTSIAPHTAVAVKLGRSIDSGRLKNGDTVQGTLVNAVALAPKGTLEAGSPVDISVVETLPAGRIYAAGEFSLQLERVGSVGVYTDTLTYRGQPGRKDLPDSAPAVGTDAGLAAGAQLTFHVLPSPEAVNGPPNSSNGGPGGVNGEAAGGPPPPGSSQQPKAGLTQPGSGNTNPSQAQTITPAANTPESAENLGKSSPAANQPASPSGTNSTQTTQPHP